MRRLINLLLPCLAGCASLATVGLPASAPPRDSVSLADSEFEPSTDILGIETVYDSLSGLAGRYDTFFIHSRFYKQTRRTTHQLVVRNYYRNSGLRFWERANLDDARSLEVTPIKRDVESCSGYGDCVVGNAVSAIRPTRFHYEDFGIGLPDELIRARVSTGFAVKVYARSGETMILRVPPRIISLQLAALDSIAKKYAK